MRFGWSIVGLLLTVSVFVGCSSGEKSEPIAGIEIGNPALALTAAFSVDYSEVESYTLKKSAAEDEPMLLDSFSMNLSEVRSFSSYYVAVSIDPKEGLPVWPEEDAPDATLPVSFTEGSLVDESSVPSIANTEKLASHLYRVYREYEKDLEAAAEE